MLKRRIYYNQRSFLLYAKLSRIILEIQIFLIIRIFKIRMYSSYPLIYSVHSVVLNGAVREGNLGYCGMLLYEENNIYIWNILGEELETADVRLL